MERRRVAAETEAHARALADNLVNQGYAIERTDPAEWVLRRRRRRGDQVVVIAIARPWRPVASGPPPGGGPWGPPTGPPAG